MPIQVRSEEQSKARTPSDVMTPFTSIVWALSSVLSCFGGRQSKSNRVDRAAVADRAAVITWQMCGSSFVEYEQQKARQAEADGGAPISRTRFTPASRQSPLKDPKFK